MAEFVDEKASLPPLSVLHTHPEVQDSHQHILTPSKRAKQRLVAIIVLLLCSIWYFSPDQDLLQVWRQRNADCPGDQFQNEIEIVDFEDITPSEKLEWHTCFGGNKCARLTVPMDYNRPLNASKNNPKVHVALIMIPGIGHAESGRYSKAPLLINPGGPGGSGVGLALAAGSMIQKALSTDGSQDIVGFDPRGVGMTTPPANCWSFPDHGNGMNNSDSMQEKLKRIYWMLTGADDGLVNSSSDALAKLDRRARAMSMLCKKHDDIYGDNSILRHLSTPAVAQDMVSIIDAWDTWKSETDPQYTTKHSETAEEEGVLQIESKLYSKDLKAKLLYLGFSYGTLLGSTFAAMFPNRVGRLVLDGVVDADYYVSPVWAESLHDSDSIFHSFNYFCHKAGNECKIFRHGDSVSDIQARVNSILESLQREPVIAILPAESIPFIFTLDLLKTLIFVSLYNPTATFPRLADIFDALYRHDVNNLGLPVILPSYELICKPSFLDAALRSADAQRAIMCSDKRYKLNETLPNLEQRFERMANKSWFADVWMSAMIGCDAWAINATDPPMRWDNHPAHRQKPIRTSFPLLFVSNTLDPVTPLVAGVKMAQKFVDAGFIEQHSEGHCTLNQASACTVALVSAYLSHGIVPPSPIWGPKGHEIEKGNWTKCPANEWPWKHQNVEELRLEYEGQAHCNQPVEVERLMAWKEVQEIAKDFIQPPGWQGLSSTAFRVLHLSRFGA